MPRAKRKFTVILEPEAAGGYSVHCPALPGCVSQGENLREALRNIKEAIRLALETLEQDSLLPALALASLMGNQAPPYEESPELIGEEIRQILIARDEDGLSRQGVRLAEIQLSIQVPA